MNLQTVQFIEFCILFCFVYISIYREKKKIQLNICAILIHFIWYLDLYLMLFNN